MEAELSRMGFLASDFGSHSIRKGAATFVSSGSTGGPSQTCINLRVGWAMGQVQDTYLRYDHAGDMFVGRAVAALPLNSAKFAMLPPYSDQPVDAIVSACFPLAPPRMRRILEMCLVSVVYHRKYLREKLPASSPVFASPLFTQYDLEELAKNIKCHPATTGDKIAATGIPPHVEILTIGAAISTQLDKVMPAIQSINDTLPSKVVDGVAKVLEQRAVQASAVTPHQLKAAISEEIDKIGVPRLISLVETLNDKVDGHGAFPPALHVQAPHQQDAKEQPLPLNRYRSFPVDYQIPICSPSHAWLLWMLGDSTNRFPPLRHVHSSQLKSRKAQIKRRCQTLDPSWVASKRSSNAQMVNGTSTLRLTKPMPCFSSQVKPMFWEMMSHQGVAASVNWCGQPS
jgi:hypothetical protein